ncbi:ATPase, T2SS/T4P/T4SS family [Metabacillus niabensis]
MKTEHIVLSTMHTGDVKGAIYRLLDLMWVNQELSRL